MRLEAEIGVGGGGGGYGAATAGSERNRAKAAPGPRPGARQAQGDALLTLGAGAGGGPLARLRSLPGVSIGAVASLLINRPRLRNKAALACAECFAKAKQKGPQEAVKTPDPG